MRSNVFAMEIEIAALTLGECPDVDPPLGINSHFFKRSLICNGRDYQLPTILKRNETFVEQMIDGGS